jgi:hypothetical protein
MQRITSRRRASTGFVNPEDWGGKGFTIRIPGMRRAGTSMRWCVPVEDNLTRLFYSTPYWPKSRLHRFWKSVRWPYDNWKAQHNFQNQDRDVAESTRWDAAEFLSSTDSMVVAMRKLFVMHARNTQPPVEVPEETTAETLVYEADRAFGVKPGVEVSVSSSTQEKA